MFLTGLLVAANLTLAAVCFIAVDVRRSKGNFTLTVVGVLALINALAVVAGQAK